MHQPHTIYTINTIISSIKGSSVFGATIATVWTALMTHLIGTMNFLRSVLGLYAPCRIIVATPKQYTPNRMNKLPAEIRVHIYGYVLQSANRLKRPGRTTPDTRLAETSILAVNKLCRHEATPVFYENNTFALDLADITQLACPDTDPQSLVNAQKHPLVNAQELDKPYRDIQILCNTEGFKCGDGHLHRMVCRYDRARCLLRVLEHLLEHADMSRKLQTVLVRLGEKSSIPLLYAINDPGTFTVLCTAVGRFELTSRLPGMPKITLEHTTVVALWEYHSGMSLHYPWSGDKTGDDRIAAADGVVRRMQDGRSWASDAQDAKEMQRMTEVLVWLL